MKELLKFPTKEPELRQFLIRVCKFRDEELANFVADYNKECLHEVAKYVTANPDVIREIEKQFSK